MISNRTRGALALAGLLALVAWTGCGPAPGPSADSPAGTPAYVMHAAADQLDTWRGVHYDGLLLDVRTPAEWDDDLGHFAGAVQIPVDELESRLAEIDRFRTRSVMIYDRLGATTPRAGQILVTHGFRDVSALDGGLKGYRDWQKAQGMPPSN